MIITSELLVSYMSAGILPFARIAGLCMVAPIFGALFVPTQVRVILAVALTWIVMQWQLPQPASLGIGLLPAILREVVIGIAMGFVAQMVFDAVVVGGQTIAMSMGLGFATMVDPQRGSVPVLSQFYIVVATLLFLALDAHLVLLRILLESFQLMPAGTGVLASSGAAGVAGFGTSLFSGAIQLALPAVIALLIVNLAFGVMSRAAPSMNLFAVGFPVTMLMGFFILTFGIGNSAPALNGLIERAFSLIARLAAGG